MGAKCVVLVKKTLGICKYPHIYNEVDVGQNMKKPLKHFCDLGMRSFIKFLNYLLHVNGCIHVMILIVDK
jgi:hypothetical protein